MKIAVFVMSIMVMCICPGSISEEKNLALKPRHVNCRFPKGKHGSVRTDGCIKSTCSHGKWKPTLRTDICCYKQQVHKPNTVLDTIAGADNCSSTTIGCGAVAQIEFNHKACAATKQQVEQLEMNMEKIEELVIQIENVTEKSGKQADEIYKTVIELDKKMPKVNNSIEKKVDGLKNTTTRQSEELSEKVNDVVQNIENNKMAMENHVNDLSRKLENQTEEIVMKINQTEEQSKRKFHNLNTNIENQVNDLSNQVSRKLENQTEEIVMKMNQTEEQGKEIIGKMQTLENQMDNLSDRVSRKLENQTELTNNLTQMVKDNIADQNEMFLQMMRKMVVLTEMLEKHTMVEGVLITGGARASISTELFLPHTGKTCSLQSLPNSRYAHSMDVVSNKIIMCGGRSSQTSCLQFLPNNSTGSWANYATLAQGRYYHTTHVVQEDLLLMGGGDASSRTTEIISKGNQYTLQQYTYQACSIPDQSSTIITGGDAGRVSLKTVAIYNMQGFVENLPDLATGRRLHCCGSYIDKQNTKVLVVAGGFYGGGHLSDTELLSVGATAWQTGESLPRALGYVTSVSMGSYILLIGGAQSDSEKILKFDGTWTEVGVMKYGRYAAAATKIKIKIDDQLDITGCY